MKKVYLVVHTGSRQLGLQVANYYQELAYEKLNKLDRADEEKKLIQKLKTDGRHSEIQSELKKLKASMGEKIPKELAYCEGVDFDDYIHDMKIVQEYANLNRLAIVESILYITGLTSKKILQTIHNYIDTKTMILRKGAISAEAGEELLIPINMRDGSILGIGKGNDDWNKSAPHGAGRLMSRSKAKETLSLTGFKIGMDDAGVYSSSINESTLDESPEAYKTMSDIIDKIGDTVEIIDIIRPIYNFKSN